MRILWTIALLLSLGSSLEAQGDYETPPKLRASDVLPTDMQAGEHFTVRSVVENDGVANHYTVDSDYGPFEAYGDLSLAILIRQIHAIGELQQVSKSKEFVKAVGRSATSQLKSIKQFGEHPVDTIKGMPNGIKHMFHRYKDQAKQGYKKAHGMP